MKYHAERSGQLDPQPLAVHSVGVLIRSLSFIAGKLPLTFGRLDCRMSESIDHVQFLALLTRRFPGVAAAMDDCSRGLLHLEMATLARATQAAIDIQDTETVVQHFQFVDELFRSAAPDVENAVNVSYLENLRFEGRKAEPTKARELLTPRLRQALIELEAYLAQLHGS